MASVPSTESSSETSSASHTNLPNSQNPSTPLLTINTTNITKLTPTNFITWSLQIQSLLEGYDLYGFLDGSQPCPPSTIFQNDSTIVNPDFTTWKRQDRLLFSALLGAISQPLQPLLTRTSSSQEAWNLLTNTYAKPSRGHIKQIKDQIKTFVKGTKSITEYLNFLKTRADELTILGKPLDDEDLTEKILDGLDEEYKGIVGAVNARNSPISFDELFEKLINKEASLRSQQPPSTFPVTANRTNFQPPLQRSSQPWRSPHPSQRPPSSPHLSGSHPIGTHPNRRPSRPYLGYCQRCGIQGHTAKHCPTFCLVNMLPPSPYMASNPNRPSPPSWQPRSHFTSLEPNPTPTWLLDSGASHHITSDLDNLSLHSPYDGADDVMIGDGTGLPISHSGSTTLSTSSHNFQLNDVLCVPSMAKNLISIYQFCTTNNVIVEFSPHVFLVKDLSMGAILLTGKPKDGVYEWPTTTPPTSTPIIAFSSAHTTSSA